MLLLGWLIPMCAVAPEALAAPYVAGKGAQPAFVGLWLAALPVGIIAGDLIAVGVLERTACAAWSAPPPRHRSRRTSRSPATHRSASRFPCWSSPGCSGCGRSDSMPSSGTWPRNRGSPDDDPEHRGPHDLPGTRLRPGRRVGRGGRPGDGDRDRRGIRACRRGPSSPSRAHPGDEHQPPLRRPDGSGRAGGQDLRTVVGDGDRVLEVGREAAVQRHHGPSVSQHPVRQSPTFTIGSMATTSPARTLPVAGLAVVGDLRLLVEGPPDPVRRRTRAPR